MIPITLENYLGQYAAHPDITSEIRGNAARWLRKWNDGLLLAEVDGVRLHVNPLTGCYIGGSGNGGVRPQHIVDRNGRPIGAGHSRHKDGRGGDTFDPERELAAWSIANKDRLLAVGIRAIEDPRWTPTWCHWQDADVPSGHFVFIPSAEAPLVAEMPKIWTPRSALA